MPSLSPGTIAFATLLAFAATPVHADGDAENGRRMFTRCQACHSLAEGKNLVGPSLYGLFGRTAGSLESFPRYSAQMKASGVVWDEATLFAYVENPRAFIPGTTMAFPGLRKAEDRADLIAFLERATAPGTGE